MALHILLFLLLVCLLLTLVRLCFLCWSHHGPARIAASKRTSLHRLLKPRTPDDCPACRLGSTPSLAGGTTSVSVRPWCEVKSRRGAPKRIDTAGFACPNQQCAYYGNTYAQFHALVGDGKHGRAEPIQTFRCQACRTTFTRPSQHSFLSTENSLAADRPGAVRAGRGAGPICCRAGLRLSTSHDYKMAHSRWRTCPDLA